MSQNERRFRCSGARQDQVEEARIREGHTASNADFTPNRRQRGGSATRETLGQLHRRGHKLLGRKGCMQQTHGVGFFHRVELAGHQHLQRLPFSDDPREAKRSARPARDDAHHHLRKPDTVVLAPGRVAKVTAQRDLAGSAQC
jgi:hypothetical protein